MRRSKANENAESSDQNVFTSSVNFCNAENDVILLKTAETLISSKNNNRDERTLFYLTLVRNLLLLRKKFLKN